MNEVLNGRLEAFRVHDLLTLINLGGKTGTLVLGSRDREARILFHRGLLRFATSNQPRFRLGVVLEEKGGISREQSRHIDDAMKSSNEKFGEVAVRLGICNTDEVRDYLKIQVSEIVYDTFLWDEGQFRFIDAFEMPDWAVTINADVTNLIMEGARRIDEWNECLRLIPDDQVIYRVVANPENRDKISLSMQEWQILFRIDGTRTLRQIIDESGCDPLELYRVVWGLQANQLIEPLPEPDAGTVIQVTTVRQKAADKLDETGVLDAESQDPFAPEDDTPLLIAKSTLRYNDLRAFAPMVGRLLITGPDSEPRIAELRLKQYTIGRSKACEIQLSDPAISRQHAKITRQEDGYVATDLGSHNGMRVNGRRGGPWRLRGGDVLSMGRTRLEYQEFHDVPDLESVSPTGDVTLERPARR